MPNAKPLARSPEADHTGLHRLLRRIEGRRRLFHQREEGAGQREMAQEVDTEDEVVPLRGAARVHAGQAGVEHEGVEAGEARAVCVYGGDVVVGLVFWGVEWMGGGVSVLG
jgi:hypothetical protein